MFESELALACHGFFLFDFGLGRNHLRNGRLKQRVLNQELSAALTKDLLDDILDRLRVLASHVIVVTADHVEL